MSKETLQLKLKEIRLKIRAFISKLLAGTHNHYACYLSGKTKPFSAFFFNIIFSGVKIDKEQAAVLQNLKKEGIVVFANKYKSYFEFIFYHTRYRQLNLPFPEIGFYYKLIILQPLFSIFRIILAHLDHFYQNLALPDPYKSGYIRDTLVKGSSCMLSLIDKKGFSRRFVKAKTDPLQYLIEMQESIDRPVFIVPQLLFFSRNPHRSDPTLIDMVFGSEEHPGRIRRMLAFLNNPGKVFVEISEPLNLNSFLRQPDIREMSAQQKALTLRRQLISQINRHRQSITGPILKTRVELKQNILTDRELQKFLKEYAEKKNIPLQQVYKKAESYLEEIAAGYSRNWIKVFDVLLTWILRHMFDGMVVDHEGLNRVKRMSRKGPLILIPCHKSHVDYLILSYIFYRNQMPCPLIAAGKNLSFWPLGSIFRKGGAFFLRRSFRGATLYSKIFTEYIQKILQEGFNIELFIEGGRSRTGKLLMPQLGILSILIDAYKKGACDDLIFVPIYIGYDRVLEENSYVHEIEGGKKDPESLQQVIKARKSLKKRYGKVYVNFNEPISLKDQILNNGTSSREMTPKDLKMLRNDLGYRLISAINNVSVVTAYGIVAGSILNASRKIFSYDHLRFQMETYLTHLDSQNAKLADTLLANPIGAIDHVIDTFVQRKFIKHISRNKEEQAADKLFKVNENKRPVLDYYKNNCIAYFIPAAFTSISILEIDAFLFSTSDLNRGYSFLHDLFKNEFAYGVDNDHAHLVRKNLKAFIDDGILTPHPTLPDTYNLTSVGYRKLKIFAGFLRTYVESYWVVLNFFSHYAKGPATPKERRKKIHDLGERMFKNKEITKAEALSTITYDNAVAFFNTQGIGTRETDNKEKIELYENALKKYLNLLP